MPTVAFVGNCQAQALEAIFALHTDWQVTRLPPVFEMSHENRSAVMESLAGLDLVFAQRIQDDYPVDFVRTGFLKANLSNVVSWPNIYFSGYFPDIEYVYWDGVGKLVGPLDDYHSRIIYDSYKGGLSVDRCLRRFSPEEFASVYSDPIETSLSQLRQREEGIDLRISDFIRQHLAERKLFYTVNHPSNFVLFEMARRMAAVAEQSIAQEAIHPYALARINIPVYAPVQILFGLARISSGSFVGINRLHYMTPVESCGTRVFEDLREMIEAFYRFYGSMPALGSTTP